MASALRPINTGRVSMLAQSQLFLSNVRVNTQDLLKAQTQMTTGLRLTRPSDSPSDATTVMHLDSTLERHEQYLKNLNFAGDYLSATDSALSEIYTLVNEAHEVALEGMNSGASLSSTYGSLAQQIDGILEQLVTVSNRTSYNSYIFGGAAGDTAPFEAISSGGVIYHGSTAQQQTRVADDTMLTFSVSGITVFGAMSSQVVGTADLNPGMARDTLLTDLNGATHQGVRLGTIRVSEGATTSYIDLSTCKTVGDVLDKISHETPATCTAAIAVDGSRIEIVSTAGTVTVGEVGTGTTAHDLGIYDIAGTGGMTLNGQDVDFDARCSPGRDAGNRWSSGHS